MAQGPLPGWNQPLGGPPGLIPSNAAERPAGWLPDPTGRFEERFWDGHHWTPRVRIGKAQAVDREGVRGEAEQNTTSPAVLGEGEWYPDPARRFPQRFWNDRGWTRFIRAGDAVATDVLSVSSNVPPPKNAPKREPLRTSTSPPGWRPDPDDIASERYWDGYQWTATVRPAGSGGRPRRPSLFTVLPWRLLVAFVTVVVVAFGLLIALVLWLIGVIG